MQYHIAVGKQCNQISYILWPPKGEARETKVCKELSSDIYHNLWVATCAFSCLQQRRRGSDDLEYDNNDDEEDVDDLDLDDDEEDFENAAASRGFPWQSIPSPILGGVSRCWGDFPIIRKLAAVTFPSVGRSLLFANNGKYLSVSFIYVSLLNKKNSRKAWYGWYYSPAANINQRPERQDWRILPQPINIDQIFGRSN